jgi:four helix bundle suffix protein
MEVSKVSGTSKEMEIKLLGVARASLEELLGDYCDFLRVRALPIWEKEGRQARFVRRLGTKADLSYEDYREFCETRPAAVVANIAVCLIHQTDFLLDRQIRRLERDFVQEGGLRERMTRARLRQRKQGKAIGHIGHLNLWVPCDRSVLWVPCDPSVLWSHATHRSDESHATHRSYGSMRPIGLMGLMRRVGLMGLMRRVGLMGLMRPVGLMSPCDPSIPFRWRQSIFASMPGAGSLEAIETISELGHILGFNSHLSALPYRQ